MRAIGNDNQICHVQINKQSVSTDIAYYDEVKSIFGNIARQEGFYYIHFSSKKPLDKIPSYIFINGTIALEKSHIIIEYSNERRERVYFNSDEEMYLYIKREFRGTHWRIYE